MKHDVIVIGGSYAGMAAALQLVRARRSVLVVDGGRRRNRAASHSHGFLGQDGVDPAQIARTAARALGLQSLEKEINHRLGLTLERNVGGIGKPARDQSIKQ